LTATAPRHRPLTPAMRDALRAARSQPLRRVHKPEPGQPPWPAHPSRLAALVRRGLLTGPDERRSRKGHRMDVWTITDAGVEALDWRPPTRRGGRAVLRVPGGTTRPMQLGEWDERRIPEPDKLAPGATWTTQSRALRTASCLADIDDRLRPLTPEERYRELREMARSRGVDVRDDERIIARRLDAMEEKVRGARAAA
jgi:hypothetical protein